LKLKVFLWVGGERLAGWQNLQKKTIYKCFKNKTPMCEIINNQEPLKILNIHFEYIFDQIKIAVKINAC